MLSQFQAHFTVRHGEIQSATLAGLEYHDFVNEAEQDAFLSKALTNKRLHHITDWRRTLTQASPVPVDVDAVGDFLNHMFGIQSSADTAAETVAEMISHNIIGEFLQRGIDL